MHRLLLVSLIGSLCAVPVFAQEVRATTAPPPPARPVMAAQPQVAPPAPVPVPQPAPPTAPATAGRGSARGQGGRGAAPAVAVPTTPPPPGAPRRLPTQNVRAEITITDNLGAGPAKKTVSMLVADGRSGQIRSSMQIQQNAPGMAGGPVAMQSFNITLNVDATPEVLPDGRIFITMSVQYTPDAGYSVAGAMKPAALNEALAVVLTDGKQTMLAQSADPQGERRVTLEVTATVVK